MFHRKLWDWAHFKCIEDYVSLNRYNSNSTFKATDKLILTLGRPGNSLSIMVAT